MKSCPVKSILSGLALCWLLAACETVDNMRDMKDAQVEIKGLITEAIGVEPLVGFNLDSGSLIDVSVAFNAGEVPDRSVAELVRAARHAVKSTFKTKPLAIYIQIATTPE